MAEAALRDRTGERRAAELMRAAVLAFYGEVCACCGTTADLGIDHVNGGGPAQRAAALGNPGRKGYNPALLYRWIIENGFPEGFQTHCKPCNSSKGSGEACGLDHSLSPEERRRAAARRTAAAWRERHGVSSSVPAGLSADVLRYLGEHGPARSGAVARDLGKRPGIISACMAALAKDGQVENPAYGVYRLPAQTGELPGVGFGSRRRARPAAGTSGADAQAAWRAKHGTSRHVATRPGTAGGRIIEYLREHGPSHVDAITTGTGLSHWSVQANVAGLLQRAHVERHTRMDGPYEREVRGVYRLPDGTTEAHVMESE